MRHVNIPIFIPNFGCHNSCVFCDQKVITEATFKLDTVRSIINNAIEKTIDCERDIAFFGGTFTGINHDLMISLLNIAQEYVDKGFANGIRFSTRPDYINEDIIESISGYSVRTIELGIQSMNDRVLEACCRGHDGKTTKQSVDIINEHGYDLVGQMMIGLPMSTVDDEIDCAKFIIDSGADASRIYPTIVIKGTELHKMTINGSYIPLEVEDAINRSEQVYDLFQKSGVKCIRIGLCDNNDLHNDKYYAGPNDPSLGEQVISRNYLKKMLVMINKLGINIKGKSVVFLAPHKDLSKAIGKNRKNIIYLTEDLGLKDVKIRPSNESDLKLFSVS